VGQCLSVVRGQRHSPAQQHDRLSNALRRKGCKPGEGLKVQVESIEIFRALSVRAQDLCSPQLRLHGAHQADHRSVLEVEHVLQRSVVFVGPQVVPGRGLDQPYRQPQAWAGVADTALHQIAHAETIADRSRIHRFTTKHKGRVARNDEEPRHARQTSDQVFCKAVRKILLFWIPAPVPKRKNRDGGLVQWCKQRGVSRGRCRRHRQQQTVTATMPRFHEPWAPRIIAERTPQLLHA